MIKKLCATGIVVAAAGVTLLAAPAHADTHAGNAGSNHESSQSGNNISEVVLSNVGGHGATNVNNVNGNATTAADGSDIDVSAWLD
ncbi:hypothetical protein HII36_23695 [Nonomuraea sp. NN258]|uniref:hypothetical protein n=1 Tax=Nonomuraea antri TaxID=2730852 RepID=UPI001568543E|nr:hypothetical protein [Nonomuraea antri]NRQ34815.1 hypothetical protein [Nonomuraea antri]